MQIATLHTHDIVERSLTQPRRTAHSLLPSLRGLSELALGSPVSFAASPRPSLHRRPSPLPRSLSAMSGPRSVPSAAAVSSASIPVVTSTDSFSPALFKFVFYVLAACTLIWLLRVMRQVKRTVDLWRALQKENVVRVEGAAAAAHLTRDALLAILRSRSTLTIEAVESLRVRGHVHTKLCRVTRMPVAPAAAAATLAAGSSTEAAMMSSPAAATATASTSPFAASSGASSSPQFFNLSLHLSATSALKVEVYVGVPVRLVQSMYTEHDKFVGRRDQGHGHGSGHGYCSSHGSGGGGNKLNAAAGHSGSSGGSGGGKAKTQVVSSPRRSGEADDADERKQSAATSTSTAADVSAPDQIEMAILPSASSPLGGVSSFTFASVPAGAGASAEEHAQFLRSYILDSLAAGNGAEQMQYKSLLHAGEFAWKSNALIVQPPPPPSLPPPPPAPAAIGASSSSSPLVANGSSSSSSSTLLVANASSSSSSALVANGSSLLSPLASSATTAAPVVAPQQPTGAVAPFQHVLQVAIPVAPLLAVCTEVRRALSARPRSASSSSSAAASAAAGAVLAYPLLVHVTPIDLAGLSLGAMHFAAASAASPKTPGAAPRKSAAATADSATLVSEITLAELTGADSSASSSSSSSSATDADSLLSRLKFEQQLLLVSASSTKMPESSASRIYDMEELYDLHTGVTLPPPPSLPPLALHGITSPSDAPGAAVGDGDGANAAASSSPPPPASSTATSASASDDSTCVACMSAVKDIILLPCRHVCLCGGCFESITKCPVCRAPIMAHMKFVDEATHRAKIKRKQMRDKSGKHRAAGVTRRIIRPAAAGATPRNGI